MQLNWRRNRALDRWLDYLLRQGHSMATMRPARRSIQKSAKGASQVTELA